MRRLLMLRLSTAVALGALAAPGLAKTEPAATPAATGARYGSFGIDLTTQEKTVKPGDDFWTFANGGWDKRTQIAPDRTSAGYGVVLTDEAEANVRKILDDAAANPAAVGAGAKQFGDLYASFMDEAAIDKAGAAPLAPYFAKIDAATDRAKLQTLFATTGYASPVEIGQLPTPSDPS